MWDSKKRHLLQNNGNRKAFHVPNTRVISRLQRAWGMIQPNEASCSSESSLSWLQMGQLGDDEKLWEDAPKLCLCICLEILQHRKTPAIQMYNISRNRHVMVADIILPDTEKIKQQIWYTIFNQVWEVYCRSTFQPASSMLASSWAINLYLNLESSKSKSFWGHWQYVWLIMTHESTLTLVIAGFWLVTNGAWESELKCFPLLYSWLLYFIWQVILLSPSLIFHGLSLYFISPFKIVSFFLFRIVWESLTT